VVALDKMLYEDARKDFTLSQRLMESASKVFEEDPFARSVQEHIKTKTALGEQVVAKLLTLMQ
jgi:hypothetical protein